MGLDKRVRRLGIKRSSLLRHGGSTAVAAYPGMGLAHNKVRVGSKGFSLVEILTAIVLTGIISFVAVPNASAFFRQYRLISAANQLGFEIQRARMQAVGQNVYVRLRMLSGSYVREVSTDGVNYTLDGTITLPTGTTAVVGGSGMPRFDRTGIAAAGTTVILINSIGSKAIQTNILGKVVVGPTLLT